MDVKYLTYVLEMANQKSITKAANALYISQPSLSQYLSKLEGELGTPLFVRTKNELLPTPAGELYIAAAKEVIEIAFDENGNKKVIRGTCEGIIGTEPRGENGFGYDPVFMYGDRSFAEVSSEEKNTVSHRADALRKFSEILTNGK